MDRQARKEEIASRGSEILPEVLNLVGSNALARTSQRIQQAQGSSGLGAILSYKRCTRSQTNHYDQWRNDQC